MLHTVVIAHILCTGRKGVAALEQKPYRVSFIGTLHAGLQNCDNLHFSIEKLKPISCVFTTDDTIRWAVFTCAQKLTASQLNLPHVTKKTEKSNEKTKTRMWANAQRDGRPAKYRWRPLFNAAKFGWRPVVECRAVTMPKRESRWNLMGYPKLTKRSQPLEGRSSPYCGDRWRRYCCLTSFSRLSINTLVAKMQPGKVVRWCAGGDFLRHFCVLNFQRAACSTFQTCILNSH